MKWKIGRRVWVYVKGQRRAINEDQKGITRRTGQNKRVMGGLSVNYKGGAKWEAISRGR